MSTPTIARVPVASLLPGDLIDLQGDPYADPNGNGICTGCGHYSSFEHEYAEVVAVERETEDCIVLHTDPGEGVGFPPDHLVPRLIA